MQDVRLKKLKIIGFKSFADRVILDFDAEIIGIVGPNGCGKSNIVDAFRWVMGEQSAKSMRGDKMHDVLFAGTDHRKPLNYAEVSVSLTGVKGLLSMPVDVEEVTITRRLHRNGDSEYLINQQPVRLRDIQHFFMGSGIGKNTFSVFEQGKLDQVIQLSPRDRRAIFDESAGIGRFLQQKKESLKKLEQVDENYHRMRDIHSEVEKQAKQLKRQATLAKSYQENKSRLEGLEKTLLLSRWEQAGQKDAVNVVKLDQLRDEIKGAQLVLSGLLQRRDDLGVHVKAKEEESRSFQEQLYQVLSGVKIKKAEEERLHHQIKENDEREKRIASELKQLETKHSSCSQEMKGFEQRISKLEGEKEKAESSLKKATEKAHGIETDVLKVKELLTDVQKHHLEAVRNENQKTSQLKEAEIRSEASLEKIQHAEKTDQEKKQLLKEGEIARQLKKKTVDQLSQEIDVFKETLAKLTKEKGDVATSLQKIQSSLDSLQQQHAEAHARHFSLLRLKEEGEGLSNGAKQLLKESQKQKSPLQGKLQALSDLIQPKEGHENSLAIAMRSYAQTLVVQTAEDLQTVLRVASEKKWKDFSLLCVEWIQETNGCTPSKDSLLHYVDSHPLAEHFLSEVVLSQDAVSFLSSKKKKGEVSCVSQEGFVVDERRVLSLFSIGQAENNSFLRSAELHSLQEKLEELKFTKQQVDEEKTKLLAKRTKVEDELKQCDEERRKKEMTLLQENFSLQRLQSDLKQVEEQRVQLLEEKKKAEEFVKEHAQKVVVLNEQVQHAQNQRVSLEKQLQSHEEALKEKESGLKEAKESLRQHEQVYRQVSGEWHRYRNDAAILAVREQEGHKQTVRLTEELAFLREKAKESQRLLASYQADLKALSIELEDKKTVHHQHEQAAIALKKELQNVETLLHDQRLKIAQFESEKHRLEIGMAADRSAIQTLDQEMQERFQCSMQQVKEGGLFSEMPIEEMEKTVRTLRNELEKAGAVNLAAIEEAKEVEERFSHLDKQLSDLMDAKQDLEKIIGKLETESRKLFKVSFESIRQNFQKNFSILFNGGEADLKFTDSNDVLEAGIEIIAKPPGKQMRSISLMSGGEKCMTALALLFSIFEVKPAPFCILDEVDAPLDDSNIDRFTTILKQYIQDTQFIIVTHNKKTMAIADILFGVSMEEKGVSKLISLAFERKSELAHS